MELGLAQKIAIVTGSSRGIGRGIALGLAREGCRLMLAGRDKAALESVAGEIRALGAEADFTAGDLREPAEAERLIQAATRRFGALDILVNNAGATKRGDFFALTDADFQDGFALKYFAHVRLCRLAWPLLKARGGSILQIVGVGARVPTADFTIGASVNAACLAFLKALSDIGKREGVQVNGINPGNVETDRFLPRLRQFMTETGVAESEARERLAKAVGAVRIGRPADIAALAMFILSSQGRWLQGALIDMDGGQTQAM